MTLVTWSMVTVVAHPSGVRYDTPGGPGRTRRDSRFMVGWIRAAVALFLVAGACALPARYSQSVQGPRPDSVTVVVVNTNFFDANVYYDYEGLNRRRLGMVVGGDRRTYRIPWHPSDLRIVLRLGGAGTTASGALVVSPGDVLRLEVQPDLRIRTSKTRGSGSTSVRLLSRLRGRLGQPVRQVA